MAAQRILMIHGHPDPGAPHLRPALAESYRGGARAAGREVRTVAVAALAFALLRSEAEWQAGTLPSGLASAQRDIAWADHVVLIFPLWLRDMPALVQRFLEQVARPGFAPGKPAGSFSVKPLLDGRSARVVVTIGMPSLVYRWYFGAHSVRFVGLAPVRRSLVGRLEGLGDACRRHWLSAFATPVRRGT